MRNIFKGKTILVTGGTGSIGSEIVRQLLRMKPKSIRVFARHEDRHHQLMQELAKHADTVRFVVGDIRDKERLMLAMEGVDIVFHAAALKHVPLCEYNPFEAVKTNIVGTQNVIEAARAEGVSHVIGISTDKATEPEGVLGVSKLMAEKLFLSTYFYKGNTKTKFTCVRFGNVLGSRGSILSLIKRQIAQNQKVTVTDPKMTRFLMTIPQAVSLLLDTAAKGKGQEIFVLKMPSVRLGDLIEEAIGYFAPLYGKKASEVRTAIVGKRDGEKLHEKLLAEHERGLALETKDLYILTPHRRVSALYRKIYKANPLRAGDKSFSSEYAPKLSRKALRALVSRAAKSYL
ncbi:MAG: Polysaccharide biosynthesis protein CapD [Parcubacteria group bacterium GW2011_GWA2_47_64]|nr:MAG: Polysaccharide biosynthesis protein CapD [Parcubacteria group bacterium GW2011_GWA2_47_64]KKU96547.1 MAG: Polysaccharide biosynthesis protein CapD [Parcubacteria group bacterium GW2011_GWC2_48_17]